jgi:hypothetical protein
MRVAERTLTDFLQHSGQILPEVERGGLVLRRRSGDALTILSEKHWQALAKYLATLVESTSDIQAHCQCPPVRIRRTLALSWLSYLGVEDTKECLHDLSLAVLSAFEDGKFEELTETLAQWLATGLAIWDDAMKPEEYWFNAPVEVPRP